MQMAEEKEFIHVWQGERKLLPTQEAQYIYRLRCLKGSGYLRLMSKSMRELFEQGDSVFVAGGEIVTVSSSNDAMIVELVATKSGIKHDS